MKDSEIVYMHLLVVSQSQSALMDIKELYCLHHSGVCYVEYSGCFTSVNWLLTLYSQTFLHPFPQILDSFPFGTVYVSSFLMREKENRYILMDYL